MIYPSNFEQKIGFDKIRTLVAERCLSILGRDRVEQMAFSTVFETVNEELLRTAEFLTLLQNEEAFPANYFFDVRRALARIRIEGTFFDEEEAFDLKRSMETLRDIVAFFRPDESPYPRLKEYSSTVPVFPQLIKRIDSILDKFGKVKDSASPALSDIRRELVRTASSISRTLNAILRQAQSDGLVDKDASATLRDGRLVIPLAPMHKRKIRGIVHDESATGKTVYIEPAEVVEANNRIRELENEERREIIRILTLLTDEVRPHTQELLLSYQFLADIDFLRAKALFAQQINATLPSFENRLQIDWANAVHPLLFLSLQKQYKPTVPLDIELNRRNRILLISGPNAGGKSVCLKTVGLLQYMIQCGLLVSMHERSKVGFFQDIFIDIGDEQSIENDLSTYSSHLTAMKQFARSAGGRSMVLIDEFGAGTEPQIGGAIAEALLDRFNRSGAMGVITTHYQNLKHYAEEHEGVVNGAMLYDRHEMRPLFRLSIGNPGSSFAIEIARKIGLPEEVIAQASEIVGQDYVNMDKYLQDIVRDKRYWESKRDNVRKQEKRLEELEAEYNRLLLNLAKERREFHAKARSEAQQLLSEANARIENTIRRIKEEQAEKSATREARKELDAFKQSLAEEKREEEARILRKIEKLKNKGPKKPKKGGPHESAPPQAERPKPTFAVGDTVRIAGHNTVGIVLELSSDSATVAFGHLKSSVKLARLEHAAPPQDLASSKPSFVSSQTFDSMYEKKLQFKQEIDIRGMRGDEALQAVTYFIDDAIQVGVARVRILHGTGTGALRELTRNYLRTVHGVYDFHDEHVQLGGAGITVVDFSNT